MTPKKIEKNGSVPLHPTFTPEDGEMPRIFCTITPNTYNTTRAFAKHVYDLATKHILRVSQHGLIGLTSLITSQ